jgi:hypothetical protein
MPLVSVPTDLMIVPPNNLAYDSLRPNYDVPSVAYPSHTGSIRPPQRPAHPEPDLSGTRHDPPSLTDGEVPKNNRRHQGAGCPLPPYLSYELALSTVTARRFCDQHEMSLQTATGRSLP